MQRIGRALSCTAAATLALAHVRSNEVFAKEEAAAPLPKSVELRCSPMSPHCSRIKVFFQHLNADVQHIGTSPLSGDSVKAVVDGQQVSNLNELVGQLRGSTSKPPVFTPAQALEEQRWCNWTEEKLVPCIQVNVFRSPKEAKSALETVMKKTEMGAIHRTFVSQAGSFYKYLGAKWFVKKKLKLEQDERIALMSMVDEWVAAVGSRGFAGGCAPNQADLAVFGALNSIEGLLAFEEVLTQTGVSPWYQRVAAYRAAQST